MKKGFTLVELLISITIISILTVLGFSAYAYFQKSARDAKRQSDVKFIQSALEQFHADQHYYPLQDSGSCPSAPDGHLRINCPLTSPDGKKAYLTKVPADPKTQNSQYSYQVFGNNCDGTNPQNCTTYCLWAQLEGTIQVSSDTNCSPTSPYNWGITRP